MILDPVTARWAGALYELARKKGVLADVRRDVERLAVALQPESARAPLFARGIERNARRARALSMLGGAHQLTQNFVNLLFDRGREEVLADLGVAFRRRTMEDAGQVEGIVESARPLGAAEMALLTATLGKTLGKELLLSQKIVPELVGGVRVIADDRMIDYSVQGRLESLRRKLLDAPLPTAGA